MIQRLIRLWSARAAVGVLVLWTAAAPLYARDFPKPIAVGNPFRLAAVSSVTRAAEKSPAAPAGLFGPLGGGRSDFGYHSYVFEEGPHDLFSLRQRTAVVLYVDGRLGLTGYYDNYLLVGPVTPGEDAFSIAEWNMNAIQFEYGVVAAVRLKSLAIALEYGRTSQHPLRSSYSEVSSDVLELAVHPPALSRGRLWWQTGLRVAHVDLYDFWQSPLLPPRTRLRVEAPAEGRFELLPTERSHGANGRATPTILVVARVWPRLLVMRSSAVWPYADTDPKAQAEIDAEFGLRLEKRSAVEVLLELYATRDSEQLRGEPAPLTTVGIAVRMATR